MTITKRKTVAILICCAMLLMVLVPLGSVARAAGATFSPSSVSASSAEQTITISIDNGDTITGVTLNAASHPYAPVATSTTFDTYEVKIPANTYGELKVLTTSKPTGDILNIAPPSSSTLTVNNYTVDYDMNSGAKAFFLSSQVTGASAAATYSLTGVSTSSFGTFNTSIPTGSLTLAQISAYTYTPPNDVGSVTVNYSVTDGGTTKTGVITLRVRPVAVNDSYSTPAGTLLTVNDFNRGILGNDNYPNKASSTYPAIRITSGPSYGTFTLNQSPVNGTFTYMPNYYNSSTRTDSIKYTITHTVGGVTYESAEATITFNVGSNNYWGGYSRFSTRVDTPLYVPAATGLLAGLGSNYQVQYNYTNSSSYFTNLGTDGSFTFTPPSGQSGRFTLYYTLYNYNNNPATTTSESITIDVVPVATSVSYNVTAGTAFSISSTEARTRNLGSNLRANIVTNPSHGTVTLNTDGTFTYTPTSGYIGSDSFTYTVTDTTANLTSPSATVTFNVASSGITNGGTTNDSSDIGIAVTGESVWLSYMLYALGIMSLLIGSRAVYMAVRRMRALDDGE